MTAYTKQRFDRQAQKLDEARRELEEVTKERDRLRYRLHQIDKQTRPMIEEMIRLTALERGLPEAQANAWDEGHKAGQDPHAQHRANPYRSEDEGGDVDSKT